MSHTTEIKSVPIKDIKALKAAVKDLQKQGVKCTLVENDVPRMYSPQQFENSYRGKRTTADYVLKLHNSQYDVAFVGEQEEGKKKISKYNVVLDTWNDYIAKEIGIESHKVEAGKDRNAAAIGKLTQLYTKHATINEAKKQGYNVRSATVEKDGNIQLVLAKY